MVPVQKNGFFTSLLTAEDSAEHVADEQLTTRQPWHR